MKDMETYEIVLEEYYFNDELLDMQWVVLLTALMDQLGVNIMDALGYVGEVRNEERGIWDHTGRLVGNHRPHPLVDFKLYERYGRG